MGDVRRADEAKVQRLPLYPDGEKTPATAIERGPLVLDGYTTPASAVEKLGNNHAAILAEAQQAIQKGADPVKVKARLKEKFGITLK